VGRRRTSTPPGTRQRLHEQKRLAAARRKAAPIVTRWMCPHCGGEHRASEHILEELKLTRVAIIRELEWAAGDRATLLESLVDAIDRRLNPGLNADRRFLIAAGRAGPTLPPRRTPGPARARPPQARQSKGEHAT
jgi:hypothetical protein